MAQSQDEELNLEGLLKRVKELPSDTDIDIYYDPGTYHFFIQHKGIMPFWIPRGATYLFSSFAGQTRLGMEIFLSQAVFKLKQGIQV